MPRKIDLITELYRRTVDTITSDSVAWRKFLHSAAYQYKYAFAEQVLIYAQRPRATACAELELWNKHFNRWVKRGAVGIALIAGNPNGGRTYLNHVFDVADTESRTGQEFSLWEIQPSYEADIAEALENRFGDLGNKDKITDAVISACINLGQDNIQDYLQELMMSAEGSFLEELDDDNLRVRLMLTVQASVAYTVLTRLGYDADIFVGKEAFEWVHEFNTPATVNILGSATGDISEICLREIERTVKSIEKSIRTENRTFDRNAKPEYNESDKWETEQEKGGNEYDDHLQRGKRLEAAEFGTAAGDREAHREVWNDEIDFYEATPQGNLYDHTDGRETEQLPSRDRRDGEGTNFTEYQPTGDEPWGEREDEGDRADEVGADDEQPEALGGRGSSEQSHLFITYKDGEYPPISSQADIIQLLRHGDYLAHSKDDIVSFLRSEKDEDKKTAYIKGCYQQNFIGEIFRTGTHETIGYRPEPDGLMLYVGHYLTRTEDMKFSWDLTRQLIEALIKDGNYLDAPMPKMKTAQKKNTPQGQMTLFDMPVIEQTDEHAVPMPQPSMNRLAISQETIDEFIRLGGCTRHSVERIYGYYRRANDTDENIAFLRSEYDTDQIGLIIDGRKTAASWDDNGMTIAEGNKTEGAWRSITLTWEDVDKRTRELIELGQYIPKHQAYKADEIYRQYVADRIADLYWGGAFENIPDEYKTKAEGYVGFPDTVTFYAEILSDRDKLEAFCKELEDNTERLGEYPPRLRISHFYSPQYVSMLAKQFLREPVNFKEADENILPQKRYITEDVINHVLVDGSRFGDSKLRIYSFFLMNKDRDKRAKFLQNEYGIGGGGWRIYISHDGKGLAISRSIMKDGSEVLLRWSEVEKRIDTLIRKDKYLSEAEADFDGYEKRQIARAISNFYSNLMDVEKPYVLNPGELPWGDSDKHILPQLDDSERAKQIYEMMQSTFDSLMPGDRDYEWRKERLHEVRDFVNGEYDLFPGSHFRKKEKSEVELSTEQNAIQVEPVEEAETEAVIDVDLSESGYDIHLGTWVYIGKDEVQLQSVTENGVELFDGTMFPMEMPLDVFYRRLKDNPLNDHLKLDNGAEKDGVSEPVLAVSEEKPKSRKRSNKEPDVADVVAELEERYTRWDTLLNDGGSDPLYEDGVNMGLVRNHIIYGKRRLEELCKDGDYPEIYYRDIPPVMPREYMANADRIREDAKRTLEIYLSNPDYIWCCANLHRIPKKENEKHYIGTKLGYISNLERFIKEDRLVDMRRYRNPDYYLEAIISCRRDMERVLETVKGDELTDLIFESLMNDEPIAETNDRSLKMPYEDAFFVHPKEDLIVWIYYNSDSNAGGQYVCNYLTFDNIASAMVNRSDADDFFDALEGYAEQSLVDVGTPDFDRVNNDFKTKPATFTDCTEETMNGLIAAYEKDAEEQKQLEEAKKCILDFAELEYDGTDKTFNDLHNVPIAYSTVGEQEVHEVQVYADLFDYQLITQIDGVTVETLEYDSLREFIDTELKNLDFDSLIYLPELDDKIKFAESVKADREAETAIDKQEAEYGADGFKAFPGNRPEVEPYEPGIEQITPYEQYDRLKKAYPRDIAAIRIGDFYEFFDDDAKMVAEALGIMLTSRPFPDGTRHPMCGIPYHKQSEYFDKLNDNGYDVAMCDGDGDPTILYEKKAERENKELVPEIPTMQETAKPKVKVASYKFHPEIPDSQRTDHRIKAEDLPLRTPSDKYERNVRAIRTLHQIEEENRLATPSEQKILADYSGWGGLADCFDEKSSHYEELKSVLTPDEYAAAKESTLTAFYTPPVIIEAVYKALDNIGFSRGNILEPSCGVGNFIGLLPDGMNDSRIYGVELDSLSGRMARQLHQNQSITIGGFEETTFPDSFFDVAVGNVPFGQFKVLDRKYDKHNFLIHDFFFAKALDKVRPGGVIAFITSKGTLDKENPAVRKYIAQRADLIGAIRLPDNAFKSAGTDVVADIIFLQKRDRIIDIEPDWVHLGKDENGIAMNQYFVDNPDMILGETVMRSGPFGPEPTCKAYEGEELSDLLSEAVANIHGEIIETEQELADNEAEDKSIPADPTVKNFSYAVIEGKVYYRQNSIMNPVETSVTGENRIKGMIEIRDTVKALIDAQLENYPDSSIKELQAKLNEQYDRFTAKYGLINSRGNAAVFSDDNSYFLLCSLEILDDNKELLAKADMFTKRTINPQVSIDHVDTASEALALSIGERAFVDMEYMSELTGKSESELFAELRGVVFLNPHYGEIIGERQYLVADEYLSGNVREKLRDAKKAAETRPDDFSTNVEALEKVQPTDLTPTEIGVRLGSTWIPDEDIQSFVHELLGTPYYMRYKIIVKFIPLTAQWIISEKTRDYGNVKANSVYGTKRINAYEIIEDSLNLKDVQIFDYVEDANGNKKAVLNKKETMIAQGKQEQIRQAFDEWIWKDPARRERLCKLYNEKFNSTRPREFDGSHIHFYGMNPEIALRKHQSDAVARIMCGGNSLLAHAVGAGKTFTMVAAAQESKRLGLCNKSMFVVPNHLIGQWASEYLQLYPSANILVATKKDFETKNRKKFCARIATGDYDAVIIGHSQFEKIPMSVGRQIQTIQAEIDEVMDGMEEMKRDRGGRVTVKQLAKTKKQLETKLARLNDQSRKDDVVTFEELGVDRLFVDEAHFYKNLAVISKMRNVAGIAQTEAQKSSDLYMKCRYLDELTGSKGCIFATGTPISNTMVELYTMQKYLQYDEMRRRDLLHFDEWASTFGETVMAIELAPDGTGYRAKTRFAKFFNIPELMAMFKQVADIQTADMLDLPVPDAHYHVVKVEASDIQKELVQSFAERAEAVHNHSVTSDEDNMLMITNDGRKAALDQRLVNSDLGDYEGSKVNTCVQNIFDIWERTAENKSAQLVFCDLSTPKNDGSFNVYDDIRKKLIEKGIPADEIAFIHTADTDTKKKELFGKVRRGQVRVLMGSTFKMGAGTNVQQRLIALHDLDVPWRPADLEQRAGRIVRQGNSNPDVDLYRYVTEGTFDAYSYQLLESKQKFISQIMTSKSPVRSAEDVDETALSYAEIKALASGNPLIMEKMQLDADVAKLKLQKADHLSQRYTLEDKLIKKYPGEIADIECRIGCLEKDIVTASGGTHPSEKGFSPMIVMGNEYTERADAGRAILDICSRISNPEARPLGEYRGFKMDIGFDTTNQEFFIIVKGELSHTVLLGKDAGGIITRIDNQIDGFAKRREGCIAQLEEVHRQMENAREEIEKPFPREAELTEKSRRLAEVNAELDMDKHENELVDGEAEQSEDEPEQEKKERSTDDRDDR